MDGVQCDFFSAWARLHGKSRYKDIGSDIAREQSLKDLAALGPDAIHKFFATLPPIAEGLDLVNWFRYRKIPYIILSSPLRYHSEASIEGKKEWLQKYTPWALSSAIFLSEKANLATKDGQPNVLIDDYKKNINSWNKANGLAILFRTDRVDEIKQQLAEIYKKG